MVPTYEPGDFLREALFAIQRSLAYGGIVAQVEVIDDGSPTVDVEALVAAWVTDGAIDPVAVHRRARNGGLGRCWNTCIRRAAGEYLHILHQDDLVAPQFYRNMLDAAGRFSQAGMLFCRTMFLQDGLQRPDILEQAECGLLDDWLKKICSGQRLQCPSVIVRTATYARVGAYDADLRYVIDWEMWIRIATSEPVAYVPEPLAFYRMHAGAETKRIKSAGVATVDAARGLRKIRRTLAQVGRLDCYPSVLRFCIAISRFAAYEAECAGQWHLSAKELMLGLRHFGRFMPPSVLVRHLRAYARSRFKGMSAPVGAVV